MSEFFFQCGFFTTSLEERLKHISEHQGCYAVTKTKWKTIIQKNA